MDLTSVLALKTAFLFNRGNNTLKQIDENKSCTAAANAVRVGITASQSIVPLVCVSDYLANNATNLTVKNAANTINTSGLRKIAEAISGKTTLNATNYLTKSAKCLVKLGHVGNIAYAVAKSMDAKEEEKPKIFLQAAGNCAGMYLFEHLYEKAVDSIKPVDVAKTSNNIKTTVKNILPKLKNCKFVSVFVGIGFVAASLLGCYVGEKIGNNIYENSKLAEVQKNNKNIFVK